MMLKEFGWERFYKVSNPRANLLLLDYRREKEYFEKMLDLLYESECLKRQNEEMKVENRMLKDKLKKVYDFMRQFTINGMNMLEHFLRSIGEWVQQKEAGMSRQIGSGRSDEKG